jgi:hypothetical protein
VLSSHLKLRTVGSSFTEQLTRAHSGKPDQIDPDKPAKID